MTAHVPVLASADHAQSPSGVHGWGKPSQDVKLQADLLPGLAEVARPARERAIAFVAKPIIEHDRVIETEPDRKGGKG
jgi:hypothetical protein